MAKPLPSVVSIAAAPSDEPLLAALLARLPMLGEPFPADKRANWLRMWQMALDDLYGVADATLPLGYGPEAEEFWRKVPSPAGWVMKAAEAMTAPVPNPPLPFYIDRDGFARRAGGARINPEDAAGATIYDQRGEASDLRAIVWASGHTGVAGLQLDIAAA